MNSLDAIKQSQSASFKKKNPHIFGTSAHTLTADELPHYPYPRNVGGEDDEEHDHIAALTAPRKPNPTTEEEKLNKLEKAFLAYLRAINPPYIGIQNVTLKLAYDCRFTPDFTYVDKNGLLWFVDTKGPHQWEDSLIKIKTAARLFPWAHFALAKRGRRDVPWEITVIKT
jgi:hypothetical protein